MCAGGGMRRDGPPTWKRPTASTFGQSSRSSRVNERRFRLAVQAERELEKQTTGLYCERISDPGYRLSWNGRQGATVVLVAICSANSARSNRRVRVARASRTGRAAWSSSVYRGEKGEVFESRFAVQIARSWTRMKAWVRRRSNEDGRRSSENPCSLRWSASGLRTARWAAAH